MDFGSIMKEWPVRYLKTEHNNLQREKSGTKKIQGGWALSRGSHRKFLAQKLKTFKKADT